MEAIKLYIECLLAVENFLFGDDVSVGDILSVLFYHNPVLFFGFKFLIAICFLILIRGGTPRYRYDYLTKLG